MLGLVPSRRPRRLLPALTAADLVCAAGCLAVTFLPWDRSGSVTRSGYSLLASAQRAGVVTLGWARVLTVLAYLLPVLIAAAGATLLLGWRRAAAGVTLLVGAVTVTGAAVAWSNVHAGRRFGIPLAAALGTLTLLVSLASLTRREAA